MPIQRDVTCDQIEASGLHVNGHQPRGDLAQVRQPCCEGGVEAHVGSDINDEVPRSRSFDGRNESSHREWLNLHKICHVGYPSRQKNELTSIELGPPCSLAKRHRLNRFGRLFDGTPCVNPPCRLARIHRSGACRAERLACHRLAEVPRLLHWHDSLTATLVRSCDTWL